MLDHLYELLDGITAIICSVIGVNFSELEPDDQERIRLGVLAVFSLVSYFLPFILKRLGLTRNFLFVFPQTKVEGNWVEVLEVGGKCYVSIVEIRRRFFSNKYYLYGETLDFENENYRSPKMYATFRSDSLYFHCNDMIELTFNYSSSICGGPYNRVGLARYNFPKLSEQDAYGWFVGVLDGTGMVRKEVKKTDIHLRRLKRYDWICAAREQKCLIWSFTKWKYFLAYQRFEEYTKTCTVRGG